MFDPGTWAGLAEKLGVPFIVILMGFLLLFASLKWIFKPFFESHFILSRELVSLNMGISQKINEFVERQKIQCGKLDKICDTIDEQTVQLREAFNNK